MYYSAIGLIAILVELVVNQDILLNPKESYNRPVWKVYRRFLIAVLIYHVTDILWGILESRKLDRLLFADTTVYFIAMSISIFFWAQFTVAYLNEKHKFGRFIVLTGHIIAVLITFLVVINIFVPILFEVDYECNYKPLPVRYGVLTCQILMFLLISIFAITSSFQLDKVSAKKQRYRIIASFGIIMAVLLFIQLLFPLLPVYSIGYMLGTCMLHTFVAADEKEEFRRGQEETKKVTALKDTIYSLLNNMPGMAYTKDAKTGVYLACNKEFVEYAHKENSEEVLGHTDYELFDAETAAHFVEADKIALSLSNSYVFFEDVLDAAGNQRQLQTTKLKYTDTMGRLCVLGMCQDVTDMVRIQHEHAMTKEAYESAVSTSIMYTNIAESLARDYIDMYYINKDTEEYVEYRHGEDGSGLSEVRRGWHFFSDCKKELAENVYPDDRDSFLQAMNRRALMKALRKKNTFVMTYRHMGDNGPVYVTMKVSLMEDEQFIIIGITDVDAEIRETMAKNEALEEALRSVEEANRSKTSFLSGMSHEIRTPLNSIIGLDSLALRNEKLDDQTKDYLKKIGDSANDLLSIINKILDMSRIESGLVSINKEDFSLNAMLEQINSTVSAQCNDKGLKYECQVINQIDSLYYGDENKLRTMLLNALSNAVRCTAAPGKIKLIVEINTEVDNSPTICFCIKDTGKGINNYDSGLGMEITKKVAEMMGGSIKAEVKDGVGTEFYLSVVLQNSSKKDTDQDSRIDLENMYILIVDDDPIEMEHAKTILEEVGIRADICTSGQEALRKMEVQHVKKKPYNLVLMDWNMPGMNGKETSEEIQKLYSDESTIVALTAYNWEDIKEEANQVGVEYFLSKPLFANNVIDKFEQIARKSNMGLFKKKNKAKLSGRRILLAEDVKINAEILMDSLEIENIKTDYAENGKAAVEMFEKSTAGIYAAILMDVRMPVMDGLEATRTIRSMEREDAKKIPIIALTANTFDEDVQRSIHAGMNAHISKPIEMDSLLRVLGELIYEAEQ
ncbi:MAG: response regulator [Eubacterium sp.]|nr:response regulator [Eubacterium sp.]